jgi:thymidylate kinase
MEIITISGVDGSGKSTQLSMLKDRLEREGKKVFYFHAVEFSLANRLARTLKGKKNFTPGSEKAAVRASWLSLQLRKIFLLLDIFRFKSLVRELERQGYGYLVSDRYFYDSVINILYLSKTRQDHLWLERFIPKPDRAFYMDIDAEEILRRERVPEQGPDYLESKILLFKKKTGDWNLFPVRAGQPKEAVHEIIASRLPS